jgi:glycosyltransferase involved in cell wall biosynthesis
MPLRPVVVVVPCYNEATRLQPEAFIAFATQHPDLRFVFVNDGSTDNTRRVLERLCQREPGRFSAINLANNGGKGEAVRQGMLAAFEGHPAVVGYWDADLATPLSAILELVGQLETHPSVDMVIGTRVRLMGRAIHRRAARHYVGRVFATAVSLVLGIPIYDTQCGAKVFRATPTTAALFRAPFLSHWIFDVEVIARRLDGFDARQRAAADSVIIEYPLMAWRDVGGSKLRAGDFFVAVADLVRIAVRYRLGLD